MIELVEQGRVPMKLWTEGVGEVEPAAMQQIRDVANLPVVGPHVAIKPDVHYGIGDRGNPRSQAAVPGDADLHSAHIRAPAAAST